MRPTYGFDDRPTEDLTTRARIRDAAMVEFGAKGFKGATMKSIAATAGVSVGLVQHHFGTKDGLRQACDEMALDMVERKVTALDEGNIADPQVLSGLMATAPLVQRYVARAMVDGSDAINHMVDVVMDRTEDFLTRQWPDRFPPNSHVTRDAAAVTTAMNTSIMVLQQQLARRMGFEPFSQTAVMRTGIAMFDVYEAFAEYSRTDIWRSLRAAIDAYDGKERDA